MSVLHVECIVVFSVASKQEQRKLNPIYAFHSMW